jgi:hypothetical protein
MTESKDSTDNQSYGWPELKKWLDDRFKDGHNGHSNPSVVWVRETHRHLFSKRKTIWPLAYHSDWIIWVDPLIVSAYGTSHCFVWIDAKFNLVIRVNGKYRQVEDADAFIQQLDSSDRELLRLYAQGFGAEAVVHMDDRVEQMILDIIKHAATTVIPGNYT